MIWSIWKTITHLWMMTAMSKRTDISIALIVILTIAIVSIVLFIFKDTEDVDETVQEIDTYIDDDGGYWVIEAFPVPEEWRR